MNGGGTSGRLQIALIGTRGVPARYGGFETAVEEIGRRLAERGHRVTVYCRDGTAREHLGMTLVTLPALRARSLETLSHTAVAAAHTVVRGGHDVVFLFNAANAPFVPLIRRGRTPVALHVDGLEWKRAKWNGAGRHYYRWAESLAVRWADALIADGPGIVRYYEREFGATTELLTYGAPILSQLGHDRLTALGLSRHRYHLVVARFEPENHVEEIVRGYRASPARQPLVVVGGAPYNDAYTARVQEAAAGDDRIQLIGPVWDQDTLDQLYAHTTLYLHGHSVGGTNPSLLRAMGAGAPVSAYDVEFNRDVLGEGPSWFSEPSSVATAVASAEADPERTSACGEANRSRAEAHYRWDDVASGYERLAVDLNAGRSRRRECTGRRRSPVGSASATTGSS